MIERTEPAERPEGLSNVHVVTATLQEIDGHSILELDIWRENAIGNMELVCRHFLDKEAGEYDTLFMSEQKFRNRTYHAGQWAKIRMQYVFSRGNFYYSYWTRQDVKKSFP